MNKRGQIYLLVAIILCFIIYLLVVERNISVEKVIEDDFKELSSNYEVEGSKFVNALLLSNERDVSDYFINFSILYSSYARAQNPYFGLIYAFYDNNVLYLGNYMDQPIMVDYKQGVIGLNGCYNDLSATIDFAGFSINPSLKNTVLEKSCIANVSAKGLSEISIILNGGYYAFGISANKPEIIIVSRESLEGVSKVYVGGEFKKEISGPKEKELCIKQTNKDNCEKLGCLWKGSSCVLSCDYYKDKIECSDNNNCCWDAVSGITNIWYKGICRNAGKCLTTCSDGTAIGQCSGAKPKFCTLKENKLELVNNCGICKCSSGYSCQSSTGECIQQACTPNWQCSEWGACVNNVQTRTCTDINNCGTTTNKPAISQSCAITCTQLGGICKSGLCSSYNSCNSLNADCGSGNSCCYGTCTIETCSNECFSDSSRRCYDSSRYQTCGDYNGDSCFEWSNVISCGSMTCQNGNCISCTNACAANTCIGSKCTDSCGNQYDGTKVCVCSPDCSCASNICIGQSCTDSKCNTQCSGIKAPNWQCSSWSSCVNNQQTRICIDSNNCGTTTNKPITTQSCVVIKKFNCRMIYWTGVGGCREGEPNCITGDLKITCVSGSCGFLGLGNNYNCKCQRDYWTDCLENPSCGSDTKLSEQNC